VQWTVVGGGQKESHSYFELTPLLLRQPPTAGGPGSWHLRTSRGEDIVLTPSEPPRLTGRLSREVITTWEGKELKVPAEEIVSVYRVPKGP
jgi:hypothetical protein